MKKNNTKNNKILIYIICSKILFIYIYSLFFLNLYMSYIYNALLSILLFRVNRENNQHVLNVKKKIFIMFFVPCSINLIEKIY
jgi:hypothetical protein